MNVDVCPLFAKRSSMCSRSEAKGASPVFTELTVCESRQVIKIQWHRSHDGETLSVKRGHRENTEPRLEFGICQGWYRQL